jgi:PleD family two-component response regulator
MTGGDASSPDSLLQSVDKALCRTKSAGRNRVVATACEGVPS